MDYPLLLLVMCTYTYKEQESFTAGAGLIGLSRSHWSKHSLSLFVNAQDMTARYVRQYTVCILTKSGSYKACKSEGYINYLRCMMIYINQSLEMP